MTEHKQDEQGFRNFIQELPDGILIIDPSWLVIYANRAAEKMLGQIEGSLAGRNLRKELLLQEGSAFYKGYEEVFSTRKRRIIEDYSVVMKAWTRAVIYPHGDNIAVCFYDITTERVAETRAKENEDRYRIFLDRITDGFIVLDQDFRYVYVNQRIGELVHRTPESLIGKNVWDEFPDAVNSLTYKAFITAMKEQRFISNIDYFEPLDLWQENYIYPSPQGLSVFIKDISDRKKLEKELRERERDQQFEIMITTLEAQEKERTAIGRELHDNVNQLLVATRLMLSLFRDQPGNRKEEMLVRAIDNLEKAISENRRISHELVTPDLKDQTLVDQLEHLVQSMLLANGIKADINISNYDEEQLEPAKKLAVYRIAQEQCTNILKHAEAENVRIQLTTSGDAFIMKITDDGKGMETARPAKGIGLRNMEGRVAIFEGELNVDTTPGKGFTLGITLPLENSRAMKS